MRSSLRQLVIRPNRAAGCWSSVAERVREPVDVAGRGAAPAVDRLQWIADRSHRPAVGEQPGQHLDLGVAGVLVLVEQHHVIARSLYRATDSRRGQLARQHHVVGEVEQAVGALAIVEGSDQRQQIEPLDQALQQLAQRTRPVHRGARGLRSRPATSLRSSLGQLADLLRLDQVIGQLAGQVQYPFGDGRDHPGRQLEGAGVIPDGRVGELPPGRLGQQPIVRFTAEHDAVLVDQPTGIGGVGQHRRLAGGIGR